MHERNGVQFLFDAFEARAYTRSHFSSTRALLSTV